MPRSKCPEISISCSPAVMPEDQQKERFKQDYEFNKRRPVRASVDGWEYRHLKSEHAYAPKKEMSMLNATPHKFKHVRTGNIYASRKAVVRSK